MNKKLIVLALAGAFAAPAALASAVIYGTASVSVDYVDGGSGGASTIDARPAESRGRVSSNTSIIGFRGTEDLGGGLSAIWQVESAVALDTNATGATLLSSREQFAGLSGKNWGSVTFGLRDTALKVATGRLDVFGGGNYLADYRSIFGAVSNGSIRAGNSVTYISPKLGGLVFRGTTAAMQEEGSSRDPHLYSLSAVYEAGPLFLTLAHEDMKFARAVVGTMFGAGGNNINVAGTVGGNNGAETRQRNTRLGIGWTMGDLRLSAAYEHTDADVTRLGAATLTRFGVAGLTSASTDRDAWYLGAAFKMGKNTLKAAYGHADDLAGRPASGAQQWSLGMDHELSRRTRLYALYTQVRNDRNASYTLGGGPVSTGTFQSGGGTGVHGVAAAAAGEDPRGISLGMIHRF